MVAFLIAAPSSLSAADKPPVLVELFTSEDCPACPPADDYLKKLSKQNNVIALGCHVTYFARKDGNGPLKQADKLGRATCTQRQFDYVGFLKQKSLYTPQFLLNGKHSAVGTKPAKVSAALLKAASDDIAPVSITQNGANAYSYILPKLPPTNYILNMAVYNKTKLRKKHAYINPVDVILPLGSWRGNGASKNLKPNLQPKHAGFVLFIQNRQTGQIVAAGEHQL